MQGQNGPRQPAHLHPQVRLIGLTSSRSRLVGASAPTESEKEGWINNVCGLIRVKVRRYSQKCAAVSKIMTFVQFISSFMFTDVI